MGPGLTQTFNNLPLKHSQTPTMTARIRNPDLSIPSLTIDPPLIDISIDIDISINTRPNIDREVLIEMSIECRSRVKDGMPAPANEQTYKHELLVILVQVDLLNRSEC